MAGSSILIKSSNWLFKPLKPLAAISFLCLILFLTGCGSSSDKDIEQEETANVELKINLLDAEGLPIEGATASSKTYTVKTIQYNAFKQMEVGLRPHESAGIIRLSKTGYMDNLLYLENTHSKSTQTVTLLSRGEPIVLDGAMGGEFSSQDGAAIELPADALVKADGSSVSGEVSLYITPIDISDKFERAAFPGSFYGLPDDETEESMLLSYGVVEYSFFQDEEELQLKQGQTAALMMPLYASKNLAGEDIVIGDTMPLWTLDETTGIWVQEDLGTVIADPLSPTGLALSSNTTHFSFYNADAWLSANGGGLSGPGAGSVTGSACLLGTTVLGVTSLDTMDLTLEYHRPDSPIISVTSGYIDYKGQRIDSGRVAANLQMVIRATIFRADGSQSVGEASFTCKANTIRLITLEPLDGPPQFIHWEPTAEPVFTRSSSSGLYEVTSNKVIIGGEFKGTEIVSVNSEVLEETYTRPNQMYFKADYLTTHSDPVQITATLSNSFGDTEKISMVNYVASKEPQVKQLTVYPNTPDEGIILGNNATMTWMVEGADTAAVYILGDDPTALGLKLFDVANIDSRIEINTLLNDKTGYVRVEFTNQYGKTTSIRKITAPLPGCLPGSEQQGCFGAF